MSTTLDKDTLLKYHFWILIGLFFLFVLVPLITLLTSVGPDITKEQEKLQTEMKSYTAVSNAKNEKWETVLREKDKVIVGNKDKVHDAAWKIQEDLMTWPESLERKGWGKSRYTYFGDPIEPYDRDRYRKEYEKQLKDVFAVVHPLSPKGDGVMQFAGGIGPEAWNNVLNLVREFKEPSSAEIWLAQEDLWVKRELLRIVREANDAIAKFKEVAPETATADKDKKDPKSAAPAPDKTGAAVAPAGKTKQEAKPAPADKAKAVLVNETAPRKRFRNPFWEVELQLDYKNQEYTLSGTIKNISRHRQPVDLALEVALAKGEEPPVALVQVAREPLDVNQEAPIAPIALKKSLTVEGLMGVKQILTWKTAPVKRLDRVELGWLSSRNAQKVANLKEPKFITAEKEKDKEPSAAGGDGSGGAEAPGAPVPGMSGGDMRSTMERKWGGMMGGGTGSSNTTKNGLVLNRYLDFTDAVRFMPVGMVVVMDEDYIPEFLAAFANSKLRIMTTQYHWQHFRDKIDPPLDEETPPGQDAERRSAAGGVGVPGGIAAPGMGRGRKGQQIMMGEGEMRSSMGMMEMYNRSRLGNAPGAAGGLRMGAGGIFAGFGGMGSSDPEQAVEEDEMNLVELSVYGIASLYERFPVKEKPKESTAPAASPGNAEPPKQP
jgi:hypothetical protein